MNKKIIDFLSTPLARKVKAESAVILQRVNLSPADLLQIKRDKEYTIPKSEEICELEAGGQILAEGKIVKRKGEYYFKVQKVF